MSIVVGILILALGLVQYSWYEYENNHPKAETKNPKRQSSTENAGRALVLCFFLFVGICALFVFCFFPTLGVGLLDFKVSYFSSPAETTSCSAQPHRLP